MAKTSAIAITIRRNAPMLTPGTGVHYIVAGRRTPPKKEPPSGGSFASGGGGLFRRRQCSRLGCGCGLERRLLLPLLEDEGIALGGDLAHVIHNRTGARRNEAANDDVLLEAVEGIGLAV